MKKHQIIALSACLLGAQVGFAQSQAVTVHAAPVIKTFSQKPSEPLVAETTIVPQSKSEAEAVRIKQDLEKSFKLSINFKSGDKSGYAEGSTVLRSQLHLGMEENLASPTCDLKGTLEGIEVTGSNPKIGYDAVITPTQKTEDGIIALVNLTVHTGQYESMQTLSPGCTVLEGKQSTDSLIRVVALSYGSKSTITTDAGDEIEITLKADEPTPKEQNIDSNEVAAKSKTN